MAYTPTQWHTGDVITAEKLNKLEQGVKNEQTGPAGDSAGFGIPTASVDDNTGVPSVEVNASGPDTAKIFAFTFKNLKGAKGDPGTPGKDGAGLTGSASSIEAISEPESVSSSDIATKVNEIITQLKARGICN